MKRADPIEQMLESLASLRHENDVAVLAVHLRKALKDRSNLVIAKAAKTAAELRIGEVVPEMVAAFERLMANPTKLDKRCIATFEIAAALHALDYTEPEIYLRGIRHVQMEPSFGRSVDEAAKLRAQCALGLVRTRHPDALIVVADLLADPESHARVGAIRALAVCGGEKGVLLLRYKTRIGDENADVFAECLNGLLGADFERSLPLMRELVEAEDEEKAGAAIFALGAQRRTEAFAILKEKWERTLVGDLRNSLLTAMAMARLDEATDYLIGSIGEASTQTAAEIVKALGAYHREERVREQLKRAVEKRGGEVQRVFEESWGGAV